MRVAMFMPPLWGRTRFDYSYWTETATSLARGLQGLGVDVTLAPGEHAPGAKTIRDHCLLATDFCEKAGDFDLIHGYFDPLFATYAAMTKTPILMTLAGPIDTPALRIFMRYKDRISYISLSDGARDPRLDYMASIFPGVVPGEASLFSPTPETHLLCPAHGLSRNEISLALGIARQAGRRLVVTGDFKDKGRYEAAVGHTNGSSSTFVECSSLAEETRATGRAYALISTGRKNQFIPSFLGAMAQGTPAVVRAASSLLDFIVPGVTGFAASSPSDAADLLTRIGEIDRARCQTIARERFTMDHMVASYFQVYSAILEKTKREDHRPWGYYEVLIDEERYKVKRIVVYPGKRLSLQRHAHRAEHWHVISGDATVRCGDNEILLGSGESVDIPAKSLHRIQNMGSENVIFVEVQRGDYCGEDDIERFEDDFGRA